jgi:hypothetical protein
LDDGLSSPKSTPNIRDWFHAIKFIYPAWAKSGSILEGNIQAYHNHFALFALPL